MDTFIFDACETQWTNALDGIAAEILKRAGVKRLPVNAIDIAGRLGYRVLWDRGQTGRARIAAVRAGPSRRSQPAIFLRPDPRPERIQWAVAHEIGEQFAAEVGQRLGIDTNETAANQRERVANLLATRLLLPIHWFARDSMACDFDLVELKNRYRTASHELIARRFLDLRQPVVVTIFDHGQQQFRRWNRPRRPPLTTYDELQAWRRAHEAGEAIRRDGAPRIDVWPIHEPGWRREIIRLELPLDSDDFQYAEFS